MLTFHRRPSASLTAIPGLRHDEALTAATEDLIRVAPQPAGQVIAAVVRSRMLVLRAYASARLPSLPAPQYVLLVIGLARKELTWRTSTTLVHPAQDPVNPSALP